MIGECPLCWVELRTPEKEVEDRAKALCARHEFFCDRKTRNGVMSTGVDTTQAEGSITKEKLIPTR